MKYNSVKIKGFTLVELIVAVLILGILASLSMGNYHINRRRAEYRNAVAQVQAIVAAEKNYYLTTGVYWATSNTASTNSRLGILVQETYFRAYRVILSGSSFRVRFQGGNGVYIFDDQGQRIGCTGTDCV